MTSFARVAWPLTTTPKVFHAGRTRTKNVLMRTDASMVSSVLVRGSVVNVLDVGGALVPWAAYSAYGASKAALRAVTESLALELAPEVRVNGVAPGTVLWPESLTAGARRRLARRIPLRRVGAPDDVARAVRFLADSPFVTGATVPVDGGRHLGAAD